MRDKLGQGTTLSYCTNVHPGFKLAQAKQQLEAHAIEIKRRVAPDEALGIGLWTPYWPTKLPLSIAFVIMRLRTAITRAVTGRYPRWRESERFLQWVRENELEPVTANAFPFSDFHTDNVKHSVYQPDLTDPRRILQMVAAGVMLEEARTMFDRDPMTFSISTVPVGWGSLRGDPERVSRAAALLRHAASGLDSRRDMGENPCSMTIDLEPEPGCCLDTCDDVIAFFDEHLPEPVHRAHIGVCHDVCHAAVMFEDQREVLRRYAEAGIRVNKVQISSALDVDVGTLGVKNTIDRLRAFAEPRYLHQTGFMTDGRFELIEDLPDAIARHESGNCPKHARVHYHVPIYLDRIGDLGTTNDQIMDAVLAAREYHDTKHFEVETYAWGVLPQAYQRNTLAEGIADELLWVLDTIAPSARAVEPIR